MTRAHPSAVPGAATTLPPGPECPLSGRMPADSPTPRGPREVQIPMTDVLQHINGTPVFVCAAEGEPLRDAVDLIGNACYQGAAWVAVPADRLTDDFFSLRTRVAGEIVQKFVNYRLGLAVVGDVSRHTSASSALRDFVYESNRGRQLWFVPDMDALHDRLGQAAASA